MGLLDFQNNTLVLNLILFAIMAVVIWFAGSRLSFYADALADRTGLGRAFVGMLFLAVATEMPEIGTTISATTAGNAALAVNNMFGGITVQTVILAIADFLLIRGALTFFTPRPVLLLQGLLLILLLALTLAAASAGEMVMLLNIGLWTFLLFVAYLLSLHLSRQYEKSEQWVPVQDVTPEHRQQALRSPVDGEPQQKMAARSTRHLALLFVLGAAVILVAGFVLARVGEALAEQTGLGASFVGATLIAASTSLPELSVTIAAVRLGNYEMAFGNIFGSNSIMILLLFIADLTYREGPILNEIDASAMFAAAMGIIVTVVYLVGMVERQNRTILRLGIDSALVVILYLGSLVVLYQLR